MRYPILRCDVVLSRTVSAVAADRDAATSGVAASDNVALMGRPLRPSFVLDRRAERSHPRHMPKKRARTTKAKSTPALPAEPARARARVEVIIDKVLEKAWRAALATVSEAKHRGAGAFDELWESVAEIANHHPPLYLAGGCATFRDFLGKHLPDVDERTAKRYMRVAQFASPTEEELHTVSKIDAALSLLEAKAGAPLRGRIPVDFAKLKIPITSGSSTKRIAFVDASVEQVRAAAKLLAARGGAASRTKESPVAVALRKRFKGELAHVTVRVSGGTVSIGNIGLHHIAMLARALAGFKPPAA